MSGVAWPRSTFARRAADVGLDDIRLRVEMERPNLLQQHAARHHAPFAAHQELQKLELSRLEIDYLPARASPCAG